MKKASVLILALVSLISCGGGGGGGSGGESPDAPVVVVPQAISYNSHLITNLERGISQRVAIMGTSLSAFRPGSWADALVSKLIEDYGHALVAIDDWAEGGVDSHRGLEQLPNVAATRPDVLFIEFAVNDAYTGATVDGINYEGRGITVQESVENLDKIIEAILAVNPQCEIFIQIMNPLWGFSAIVRPDLDKYYEVYREYARQNGYRLIDYNVEWKKLPKEEIERLIPDTAHPSQDGMEMVIWPLLMEALY